MARKKAKKSRKRTQKRTRKKSSSKKTTKSKKRSSGKKKKTTRKKSRSRPRKRSWPDVPEDKAFWVRDGRVLRSLEELHAALKSMDDNTFSHHVNGEKNDFANWIFHVLDDRELAESVRGLKSRSSIVRAIKSRL